MLTQPIQVWLSEVFTLSEVYTSLSGIAFLYDNIQNTKFDFNRFEFMSGIVSKFLCTAIWNGCILQLEFEKMQWSWTSNLAQDAI